MHKYDGSLSIQELKLYGREIWLWVGGGEWTADIEK